MGMLSGLRRPKTAAGYDTVGGHEGIEVLVEDFYGRVLEDDQLATFFAGSDMKYLKSKLVELLASALGGPESYTGRSMKQAHQDRGIMMYHFALMTSHLKDSLRAAGAPPEAVTQILGFVARLAGDIASDHAAAV
ncbi:MAG: group 1 truncated hemoglobin [Mycobacterium sp.]|nr:group 1 truncated hemoglobin [Mycobacterium sp.]MBV9721343.1 group 1 truncated hemoglobin [Mycobacterium sp.]